MEEKKTEQKLVKMTKIAGGICWKFTSPGTAGVPDRIILMPGGGVGFVEVKSPGKKPRGLQHHRMEELRRLGFRVFVLDDPEQIRGILDAIQAP